MQNIVSFVDILTALNVDKRQENILNLNLQNMQRLLILQEVVKLKRKSVVIYVKYVIENFI